MELLCDSHHGVYIPQLMVGRLVSAGWQGVPDWCLTVLSVGPDDDEYWMAWDYVLTHATYTDADGSVWYLWQDGDLWAVPANEWFELGD